MWVVGGTSDVERARAEGGGLGLHCKESCLCPRGLGHVSDGFKCSKPGQTAVNKKIYIIFAFILYLSSSFLNLIPKLLKHRDAYCFSPLKSAEPRTHTISQKMFQATSMESVKQISWVKSKIKIVIFEVECGS